MYMYIIYPIYHAYMHDMWYMGLDMEGAVALSDDLRGTLAPRASEPGDPFL